MSKVLTVAFKEHFGGNVPTSFLVITDGKPDDKGFFPFQYQIILLTNVFTRKEAVFSCIEVAANKIDSPTLLSLTLVQIGHDDECFNFLSSLETDNKCKFKILDVITNKQIKGHFKEFFLESLNLNTSF